MNGWKRFLVFLCLGLGSVHGHEMRPGYLELQETEPGRFDVLWKVPARGLGERLSLNLEFAEDVERVGEPVAAFRGGAHVQRLTIQRESGLTGTEIAIEGLERTFTDVLLRLKRLDGSELIHRLTPAEPAYTVEANPGPWKVAWTYTVLGVEHILLGIDHLLFVLALLLVVKGWGKLIGTITAFTAAHSITLGMATLGWVKMPGPPVEAVIALSIVFVAAEIVRGQQGHPGLTERWPWIVAFTFGLLHGFGFAGALSEVGLPQTSIPIALLTFNIGVEIGQLMFVAVILLVQLLWKAVPLKLPNWGGRLVPYGIGSMASFWLIERVSGFWSAGP